MSIGERIKARRIELGLSQEELAHRLGNKSRASVSTVEHDKEDLTTTRIKQYATALECTPGYLMGWEEYTPPENTPTFSVPWTDKGAKYSLVLTKEEYNIIMNYRKSPDGIKESICKLLDVPG